MRRLALVSTIFGLLLAAAPGAIANSQRQENHIGEGNLQNNAGLSLPTLPGLPGLPAVPALPTSLSGPPALPGLPALPALPATPPGVPPLVGGLPTGLPDLSAVLASISTPFALEAPLGLPVP